MRDEKFSGANQHVTLRYCSFPHKSAQCRPKAHHHYHFLALERHNQ